MEDIGNLLDKELQIADEDQLADDYTKTQIAKKLKPHFERMLLKIPDYMKGFKRNGCHSST